MSRDRPTPSEVAKAKKAAVVSTIATGTTVDAPTTNGDSAASGVIEGEKLMRTDLGNARRFASRHAHRLRYLPERRRWIVWHDGRWREDTTGEAERAAKETAESLWHDVAKMSAGDEQKKAARWAASSQNATRLRAMLEVARTEPEIAVSVKELDRDPWLLAVANGTLDLRTPNLKPSDPNDLITQGTDIAYDPGARCLRWQQFLREVFADDEEIISFVQRLVGYMLTGDTREQALFVLCGAGANGKTTFIETVKALVGSLASTTPFDTLTRRRADGGPRNDLAALYRARLVVASESGKGKHLDEAMVKSITGGDTVAARFLYGEFFEFKPQFKLALVTNHRPRIDGNDDAVWRRIRLIPFEQSFQGREDRDLAATLVGELPGILAWAVAGCLDWQQHGLGVPDRVLHATGDYRREEDLLGAFIEENCTLDPSDEGLRVTAANLRDAAEAHYRDAGEKAPTASEIGQRLKTLGVTKRKVKGHIHYLGIKVNTDAEQGEG